MTVTVTLRERGSNAFLELRSLFIGKLSPKPRSRTFILLFLSQIFALLPSESELRPSESELHNLLTQSFNLSHFLSHFRSAICLDSQSRSIGPISAAGMLF